MSNVSELVTAEIRIENLSRAEGAVFVAVFPDEASFKAERSSVYEEVIPVRSRNPIELRLPDLPAGKYAIAAFHDQNNNGKLDKNWMGIPKEPYAFSNNVSSKWKAPTFEDIAVEINSTDQMFSLKLMNWDER